MKGLWMKTAASGFRMTAGTPSGRYGLPLGNRDGLRALTTRRLRVPLSGAGWSGASLAAEREICVECDDPGALPHSAARVAHPGGRKIEPQPVPVPQWHGRNGRGWSSSQCVKTKAAVFYHQPTVDRPHFSLESRPVSFSAEKEMDLAPAGQAPPGGTPPPWWATSPRQAAGRPSGPLEGAPQITD